MSNLPALGYTVSSLVLKSTNVLVLYLLCLDVWSELLVWTASLRGKPLLFPHSFCSKHSTTRNESMTPMTVWNVDLLGGRSNGVTGATRKPLHNDYVSWKGYQIPHPRSIRKEIPNMSMDQFLESLYRRCYCWQTSLPLLTCGLPSVYWKQRERAGTRRGQVWFRAT